MTGYNTEVETASPVVHFPPSISKVRDEISNPGFRHGHGPKQSHQGEDENGLANSSNHNPSLAQNGKWIKRCKQETTGSRRI
jgi:hypothetical protein